MAKENTLFLQHVRPPADLCCAAVAGARLLRRRPRRLLLWPLATMGGLPGSLWRGDTRHREGGHIEAVRWLRFPSAVREKKVLQLLKVRARPLLLLEPQLVDP